MRFDRLALVAAVAAVTVLCVCWPCQAQSRWTVDGSYATRTEGDNYVVIHDMVLVNDEEGITVTCGLANYYENERVFEFLSRVRVVQGETEIQADSGSFYLSENRGHFVGAVSFVKAATDDDPNDINLTCEELSLNTETESFAAKGQPVLRQIDENGEETVASADLIEYDGADGFVSLSGNAVMTTADKGISASSIKFGLRNDVLELKEFTMNIVLEGQEAQE